MKKFTAEIPEEKFEIFLVEFNGYGVEILDRKNGDVIFAVYSEKGQGEAFREALLEIFEDLKAGKIIKEEKIEEKLWEEVWKEDFQPIEVNPFIIIPEWEIYKGNELIPIKIKIGMSFGTGLHPTTQLVLSLLPKYISKEDTVLDIGCGTGILGIAASKLGARKVYTIDIDEKAIEECEINAWENEVKLECKVSNIDEINEKYDIVLANLQIEIFDKYFDKISNLFNKYLIISGIFKQEKDKILELAKKNNLQLVEEKNKPESPSKPEDLWYGFVFRKQDKAAE